MDEKNCELTYEDRLQYVINFSGLMLDDVVLANAKLTLTPRTLLLSYQTDAERDNMIFSLSYNIANGCDGKKCIIELLKRAAQEGKLKV